jgi:cytochrome c-type biogenesis protein CcmH
VTTRAVWWILAAVVGAAALYVGVSDRDTRTDAERIDDVAASVRCPACRAESARDSQSTSAENVRDEIARRVEAGQSDDEIRAALAASFGDEILLEPPSSGSGSVVWMLPVVAIVVAGSALAMTFRRWRTA